MFHKPNKDNANNEKLFCFFSGYTKGMLRIIDVRKNDLLKIIQFTLLIPEQLTYNFTQYIQLDGVICEIIELNNKYLTVSTTFELVENTSLLNAFPGRNISVGLLSEVEPIENQGYLLHPSANSNAKLISHSILDGHQHTLKLDFECDSNVKIEEGKHIGLSGSSLTVRNLKKEGTRCLFSIYAGKQTAEETQFNRNMMVGEVVNITQGAKI